MAKVQCPCGREYEVPQSQLGSRVKCSACHTTFIAGAVEDSVAEAIRAELTAAGRNQAPEAAGPGEAVEPAVQGPSTKKLRLGELAVERAFVSQEHLDFCLTVQKALREAGETDKRIGEILVEKGLLRAEQIDLLLTEQAGDEAQQPPPESAPPASPPPRLPERPKPEPRDTQATPRSLRDRLAPVVLTALVALLVYLIIRLWPAPAPQRALTAYLDSCHEGAIQPDVSLALTDLGLSVREFRVEELLRRIHHDYSPELKVFASRRDNGTWQDLLEAVEMPVGKAQTLKLVAGSLPEALTPRKTESLTITVQPIHCSLFCKRKGARFFTRGSYRFLVLRIDSAKWDSGWRVASCEPVGADKAK